MLLLLILLFEDERVIKDAQLHSALLTRPAALETRGPSGPDPTASGPLPNASDSPRPGGSVHNPAPPAESITAEGAG